MDPKEFRERMGSNQHFHPEKNPHKTPKQHWWNNAKIPQPQQILRQRSSTLEDSSSSPVGSPSSSSPYLSSSPVASPETHALSSHVSTSSPVGSPATAAKHPHIHFDFSKQRARSFSADDHKDSVLT